MKIINAWIDDPTLEGIIESPSLFVEVDEEPSITIQPESFPGGWITSKSGPFVTYTKHENDKTFQPVTAGDFNIRFITRFPPVVDVTLVCGEYEMVGYSLPLNRARQLVRKHSPQWRLLISDRAATDNAQLVWVPVETSPSCRKWDGKKTCCKVPTRMIRVNGIDLPLCGDHVREHNDAHAAKRVGASS